MTPAAQPVIPSWAVPPAHEVNDLLVISGAYPDDQWAVGCHDAVEWVTGWPAIGHDQAAEEMAQSSRERADLHRAAVADTIAWLIGLTGTPPLRLPRRNPDGTLVTADQHYTRLIADQYRPTPEQRDTARQRADLEYARSVRLASIG